MDVRPSRQEPVGHVLARGTSTPEHAEPNVAHEAPGYSSRKLLQDRDGKQRSDAHCHANQSWKAEQQGEWQQGACDQNLPLARKLHREGVVSVPGSFHSGGGLAANGLHVVAQPEVLPDALEDLLGKVVRRRGGLIALVEVLVIVV
eukprot:CAMPEP_0202039498 /NCGR_PEP_ID=MMETSP0962-20130828/16463_1 /ASSEMBLY_ACC=CAM_ASM_000488 /TAXON_ID=4773 /ORGANISM="Schizochytrium aggregatum, Strain ATCC28209" /LENGTH=145 /DNA_ID=CAMNT_0048603715 /DNA_START=269 /DNA_END=703 /DNA_ORIENTATION=+